jgi:hypothetical protein
MGPYPPITGASGATRYRRGELSWASDLVELVVCRSKIGGTREAGCSLVGAIVGGAATLFASLIVERKKVVRETRIRLYGKLLPAVVDGF